MIGATVKVGTGAKRESGNFPLPLDIFGEVISELNLSLSTVKAMKRKVVCQSLRHEDTETRGHGHVGRQYTNQEFHFTYSPGRP